MWPAWAQHPSRSPGDVVIGFSFYSQVWTCWGGPPSTVVVPTQWEKQSGKLYVKVSKQDLGSITIWLLGADEETMLFIIVFTVCLELLWVLWYTCRGWSLLFWIKWCFVIKRLAGGTTTENSSLAERTVDVSLRVQLVPVCISECRGQPGIQPGMLQWWML